MAGRDVHEVLTGDLDYGGGFPVTILSGIPPVLYVCSDCSAVSFHVVGEQHAGLGIKIPFARKPIASTGKQYFLICNNCTLIAKKLPKEAVHESWGFSANPITFGLLQS